MNGVELGYGLVGLALVVLGVVLAILWILVPFAIFGIKPLLASIIAELRRANELKAVEVTGRTDQAGKHVENAAAERPTLKNILATLKEP